MSEKVAVKNQAPDTAVAKNAKSESALTRELRTLRLSPRTDILEKKDAFLLSLDMPGVAKDDVKVNFEEGVIAVSGRATGPAVGERSPAHGAQVIKEYYRSFQLSDGIDFGKIEAAVADGVLTITLPKAESARPRQIEIKAG